MVCVSPLALFRREPAHLETLGRSVGGLTSARPAIAWQRGTRVQLRTLGAGSAAPTFNNGRWRVGRKRAASEDEGIWHGTICRLVFRMARLRLALHGPWHKQILTRLFEKDPWVI